MTTGLIQILTFSVGFVLLLIHGKIFFTFLGRFSDESFSPRRKQRALVEDMSDVLQELINLTILTGTSFEETSGGFADTSAGAATAAIFLIIFAWLRFLGDTILFWAPATWGLPNECFEGVKSVHSFYGKFFQYTGDRNKTIPDAFSNGMHTLATLNIFKAGILTVGGVLLSIGTSNCPSAVYGSAVWFFSMFLVSFSVSILVFCPLYDKIRSNARLTGNLCMGINCLLVEVPVAVATIQCQPALAASLILSIVRHTVEKVEDVHANHSESCAEIAEDIEMARGKDEAVCESGGEC